MNVDFFDSVEYDLLDIGDEVVFGSCVVLAPSDDAEDLPIRIDDGANVLDHSVLLGGVTVERRAVRFASWLSHHSAVGQQRMLALSRAKWREHQAAPHSRADHTRLDPAGRAKHAALNALLQPEATRDIEREITLARALLYAQHPNPNSRWYRCQ